MNGLDVFGHETIESVARYFEQDVVTIGGPGFRYSNTTLYNWDMRIMALRTVISAHSLTKQPATGLPTVHTDCTNIACVAVGNGFFEKLNNGLKIRRRSGKLRRTPTNSTTLLCDEVHNRGWRKRSFGSEPLAHNFIEDYWLRSTNPIGGF